MTFSMLKKAAEAQVAAYPQYKGHFDSYILVQVTRKVTTKGGLAFNKNELALAKAETHSPECGPFVGKQFRTVWSANNGCDVSIPESSVRVL
jgi:hypothetical protein